MHCKREDTGRTIEMTITEEDWFSRTGPMVDGAVNRSSGGAH